MYNRYIPDRGGYTRVTEEEPKDRQAQAPRRDRPSPPHSRSPGQELLDGLTSPLRLLGGGGGKGSPLCDLFRVLDLEELDSGDVLLLLIMLFLFLEGDNTEIVIVLALMLLLGLGDEKKERDREADGQNA